MIAVILSERDFDYELQALVSSFFPGQPSRVIIEQGQDKDSIWNMVQQDESEMLLWIGIELGQTKIRVWTCWRYRDTFKTSAAVHADGQKEGKLADTDLGYFREMEESVTGSEDFHKHQDKTAHPYRTLYKNKLKGILFELLAQIEPEQLPEEISLAVPVWGTMTGVRPTKIPMNRLLAGESVQQVYHSLINEYHCTQEKAKLCTQIAAREAQLLQGMDYERGYSLYVGIPFCPTTCLYCSFPSHPMERFGGLVPQYLEALKKEIRFCGKHMGGEGLASIYIGGGTPTTLSAGQLLELIGCIRESFPVEQALEFTVEAGRPDSITEEKLSALYRAGVDRISINPQTMQDKTLQGIGRQHTAEQIREVFLLARECGFSNINMDLIAGLPGETVNDFEDTLCQLKELNPDSITVHSLVVKRASKLREMLDRAEIVPGQRAQRMEQMMRQAQRFAEEHDYQPYYMYRQKNSAGHAGGSGQENIGFAREGKECLYNILMMEELQGIVAVGAGASTKYYDREKRIVSRGENVKSVTDYIDRIEEMLERKRV